MIKDYWRKQSNRNRGSVLLLAALSYAPSGVIWAQESEKQPLITDRPDFTESPQTVPAGRVQIEAGVTFERSGDAQQSTLGETLVRIAAGRKAEVRIGVPSYVTARDGGRTSGLDDAFLGAKFALSSHPKRPLALLVGTTLPTGARSVAERRYQPEAVLATAFDVSQKVGLGINVGIGRSSEGNTRFSQFFGSAALGYELTNKLGAFAEVFAFNRTSPNRGSQKYVDGGFTYGVTPDFQLDARVGFGLQNRVGGPDYFYGVGLAQRF
jgi:hypothetical protein